MKKITLLLILLCAFNASASLITVETNNWTGEAGPTITNGTPSWTTGSDSANTNGLNSGSLISDFSLSGDFNFSGILHTPSAGSEHLGFVFGWQDHDNHYRLGWTENGFHNAGIHLIQEKDGISSFLFQQDHFPQPDSNYNFFVGRTGNEILFSLGGIEQSFTNTSFMNGHVGLYTEFQDAGFSQLSVTTSVPEPSTLAILGLGLLGLTSRKLTRKNKH